MNALFPTRGVLVVAKRSQDPRATARLVASIHAREPVRIHVAAVQGRPTGYAGRFLRSIDLRRVLLDLGRESMAGLCAELDARGVPYRAHVEIGPWAATIERLARDLGCTQVVTGASPRRSLREWMRRFDLLRPAREATR